MKFQVIWCRNGSAANSYHIGPGLLTKLVKMLVQHTHHIEIFQLFSITVAV